MKKLLFLFVAAATITACGNKGGENTADQDSTKVDSAAHAEAEQEVQLPDPDATGNFGATITADGAVLAKDAIAKLNGHDSLKLKISGNINACCQAKGCWMTMPLTADKEMMVKFKDYGFFVPKNSTGKNAIIEGWMRKELISVEELRHYAEDEGKPKEEIEKITKPEERITFMADGVIIEPSAQGSH